jgi:uncharacterized SAM-binding protein YcdF (DUF218 family)
VFFIVSKIAGFLVQPSTLIALAVVGGLAMAQLTRRTRLGLRIATAGATALVAAGLLPVGNLLVLPLEQRFAGVRLPAESAIAGTILLGGFEDGWVSAGRPGLAVNEAAERLTEGLRLVRRLGDTPVVFSGGAAVLLVAGADAAGPVGRYLQEMGIDARRIVLEGRSRNTYENAVYTRDLVRPVPGRRWVLLTSAYHMPRAVGIFRKAGFDVAPYPVDFRTRGPEDLLRPFERIPAGLERLDLGAREWIGLVAYWITGRTDALLPAP